MSNYYDKDGNRKVPFKEDSTKGKSMMIPLNYKGDYLYQVNLDSRYVATLSEWLDIKMGYDTRYASEVIREAITLLVDHLVSQGAITMIEDTNEARRLLQRKYKVSLNRGNRGRKNLLHNQILSDKRTTLGIETKDRRFHDVERPIVKDEKTNAIVAKAVAKYKEMFSEKSQTVEEAVEAFKLDQTTLKEGITEEELIAREQESLKKEEDDFDAFLQAQTNHDLDD